MAYQLSAEIAKLLLEYRLGTKSLDDLSAFSQKHAENMKSLDDMTAKKQTESCKNVEDTGRSPCTVPSEGANYLQVPG